MDLDAIDKRAELFANKMTVADIIAYVNKFSKYLIKDENNAI